ncbi:MAG: hypothetical protein ACJAS2_002535 [Pseudohongiellaceae bacterium]|jgi:hypothetical protein
MIRTKVFLGARICGLLLMLFLSSCVGVVVGAVVDTTIEVAKVPFKVAGAAVDVIVPDKDDDN